MNMNEATDEEVVGNALAWARVAGDMNLSSERRHAAGWAATTWEMEAIARGIELKSEPVERRDFAAGFREVQL